MEPSQPCSTAAAARCCALSCPSRSAASSRGTICRASRSVRLSWIEAKLAGRMPRCPRSEE